MKTKVQPSVRWQGSLKTYQWVRQQIAERWGEEEASLYNPETNCFTFQEWRRRGYHVRKGEHGLKSFTVVHKMTDDGEDEEAKYPKNVFLFYVKQVEKNEDKEKVS